MVRIVYGRESYMVDKAYAHYTKDVSEDSIKKYDSFTSDVELELSIPSFWGRKFIVIRLENDKELGENIIPYLEKKDRECEADLLIILREMSKKSRIYRLIQKAEKSVGETRLIECDYYSSEKLQNFILKGLKEGGKQITVPVMDTLLRRLDYGNSCNLYGVQLAVEKLLSISSQSEITTSDVYAAVEDDEQGDVFQIMKYIIQGNHEKLFREISLVPDSEVLKVLGLLLKQFRIGFKLSLYTNREQGMKEIGISSWQVPRFNSDTSTATIKQCLQLLTETMSDVKTGKLPSGIALRAAVNELYQKMN